MRVLVAEDDGPSRRMLVYQLGLWGHEPVAAEDGAAASKILETEGAPPLVLLDWNMPLLQGIEICHRLAERAQLRRRASDPPPPYVILVTGRSDRADIVAGLEAGADDYVVKPFDRDELEARVRVGARTASIREELAGRVRALEEARATVQQLQGLLPICAWCKRIDGGRGEWQDLERYVATHAALTHGICPDCLAAQRPAIDLLRRRTDQP